MPIDLEPRRESQVREWGIVQVTLRLLGKKRLTFGRTGLYCRE